MYARRGVREVWLVDLVDRRVVVYRKPSGIGYASVETLAPGESVASEALPGHAFTVDELLGPV